MSSDPRDDVDRLFACFKCGLSTPESAPKKRKSLVKKPRASSANGESSSVNGATTASCSKQEDHHSPKSEKLGGSISAAIKFRNGKHISPIVFYGSPHGAPVKKPSQLLRLLHEIRGDLREQNKLIPREEVWATFPRQEEAVKFAKTHTQTYVFSYQDHLTGQRRFLVSTYDEFWRRYKNMDPRQRHHYEVIQEGLPCHLYFDLEFSKKVNSSSNVDEMVDILISVTLKALYDKYFIEGNEDWVLELDSSTEEKFSRHLVIHVPKTAFKDNSHVGAFVSEVCSRITSLRESDPQFEKLYIRKDSSTSDCTDHLFLDSGVYTRNRCFRLALSSKAGKNAFLQPTGRFRCKNMNEQQVFLESLICRIDVDCDKLLTCKMDLDCKKILCFETEVHEHINGTLRDIPLSASGNDVPSSYFSGRSPFPALDTFVESIASTGNISGKIRCWYWFSAYGLMIYSMSRNRYCERIGREHKSNHVIYVIDFQRAGYYQKCHDPDCKGYRSPLRPLPWDVIPNSSATYDSSRAEHNMEVLNTNLDLQPSIVNLEYHSRDGEWIMNSCKKDSSWWHEAIRYADHVESLGNAPQFSKLIPLLWLVPIEAAITQKYKFWRGKIG
ncbi:DNA-directed primase/polymerase protein isoform X2 [Asparagus officinalis]|uniref:DNA-directed primase/polymerase protein isoform X2 n=1 Tax=Asparagus officinalis TaxID=4686 RepID=UPI00098E7B7A|nr:DNA-directed primase/polymerase protein isoform X2 [Asparagus officinalis]